MYGFLVSCHAWLELWVAARCDPALADAVVRLDREFMSGSEAVFRELFADEVAAEPGLARVDIIAAFKDLLRTALPTPEGGNRHGHP